MERATIWERLLKSAGVDLFWVSKHQIPLFATIWAGIVILVINCAPEPNEYERSCGTLGDFTLKTMSGRELPADEWETEEQMTMCDWLDKDDRILMLGGNIGASCILASRMTKHRPRRVVCMEPNPVLAEVLRENKDRNNAEFEVLEGIITKGGKKNCKYLLKGCPTLRLFQRESGHKNPHNFTSDQREVVDERCSRARIVEEKDLLPSQRDRAHPVNCYGMDNIIESDLGGKMTVLFADCEGCLGPLIYDHEEFFKNNKQLRMIISANDEMNPNRKEFEALSLTLTKHGYYNRAVGGTSSVWMVNKRKGKQIRKDVLEAP